MEMLILICVGILLILGVIGSIIPILPGPILSYIALLVHHFFVDKIDVNSLIWIAIAIIFISILDYILQIYGVKRIGGGKYAIRGSLVGMLLGVILFPPLGILVGAFIGAFIGAKIEMNNPLKIASGVILGFIMGAILKLCVSIYIIYFILIR